MRAAARCAGASARRAVGASCRGGFGGAVSIGMTSGRDQVDEGEDDDPDDVDEVPVEADDLDDLGLVAGERCRARAITTSDSSMMMPTRDVDAVEAGERVEARAEQAGREAQALVVERRELVDLAADERARRAAR